MDCNDDLCLGCKHIVEGGRGTLPHSGMVKWYGKSYASTYYCRHCGKVWEYHVCGLLRGWQPASLSDVGWPLISRTTQVDILRG